MGRLTAPDYRNFLENELLLCLEDVTLTTRGRMWLQHEGKSAFRQTDNGIFN